MRRSRQRKQKSQSTQPPPSPQPQPQNLHRFRKIFRVGTEWLLAIVTIAAFLLAVVPRPIVEVGGVLTDPSNPLSNAFTIRNNNIVPLEHTTVGIELNNVVLSNGSKFGWFSYGVTDWTNHYLGADEGITVDFAGFGCRLPSCWYRVADITIIVDYQPWFLPISRRKEFRFIGRVVPNQPKHMTWEERPGSEPVEKPSWIPNVPKPQS